MGETDGSTAPRARASEVRSGTVGLSIPAGPGLLSLARATAAATAARLDFSYDEIEDLRLAVDELCFSLTGAGDHAGQLHLTFSFDDDLVEVEGWLEGGPDEAKVVSNDLSETVLDALVDEHGTSERRGDGPRAWLRKRRSPGA